MPSGSIPSWNAGALMLGVRSGSADRSIKEVGLCSSIPFTRTTAEWFCVLDYRPRALFHFVVLVTPVKRTGLHGRYHNQVYPGSVCAAARNFLGRRRSHLTISWARRSRTITLILTHGVER
ncbi:hypothetical protein BO86DRAFT_54433 [Aspergillus japonicus CBS 114.51]|uniref:Uncharacterized protein n=1 Tax=Aspergillus japonicus CBS 114.51 TaxID=1448312 RepID=A0A8T8X5D3_ASPJA|nr:hypothetical protein BO86DRAFT_54433 [Aspergillus japonicus CBS 114.51]RAH83235.1 hypothetical protein BO86DRAFT_54433 [Aspergillus japonicus CBS 114.51]